MKQKFKKDEVVVLKCPCHEGVLGLVKEMNDVVGSVYVYINASDERKNEYQWYHKDSYRFIQKIGTL